jgi:hypothetical protein
MHEHDQRPRWYVAACGRTSRAGVAAEYGLLLRGNDDAISRSEALREAQFRVTKYMPACYDTSY